MEDMAAYLRQFHDEAYLHVEQAVGLDERNRPQEAVTLYESGLRLLEQGLAFPCEDDESRKLRSKMTKTKEEVLARLNVLAVSQPPTYEEACASADTVLLAASKSAGDLERLASVPAEAELVFTVPTGAQLFFVSGEGHVSAPSYPTSLSVYRFRHDASSPTTALAPAPAPAFLRVGRWTYPLHPGRSPVLHSSYGAYVFPDTDSTGPGAAVGLLLDDKDVDANARRVFEHLLCELTAMREDQEDAPSSRLSQGIVQGAARLSQGVAYGAEKTTYLVKLGAEKLRERIAPGQKPLDVDPRVSQGARVARDVSGTAVRVSGYVVSRLGAATAALGRHLAPHVRHHGSRLLGALSRDSVHANSTMDGILEVASGGLQGFSTVYLSLESAAIVLARGLADQTVQLVDHKYGREAGSTANDALYAAGNLAVTAHNVNALGVKAIAKRTAKDAGKAVVEDFRLKKERDRGPDPDANGPPK